MSKLFQAQICHLKELNNLFIELTAKNCNRRCKHCYIDFPYSKNIKDFISIDLIKEAINDTKSENLECIYLTGAEPMTHPDFNTILRLCLRRTNVCICTNGTFINEKKARFLKKVEDESDFEIIFQLSIDHYDEIKSDDIRGRGTYRQTLNAVKSLIKYDFNPVLCVTDYYKEGKTELLKGFQQVCKKIGFEASDKNFKINQLYTPNFSEQDFSEKWEKLDCKNSRILTAKGVYSCPFLANDHRGRVGSNFKNYTRKTILETDFCATCLKNKTQLFSIDFKNF